MIRANVEAYLERFSAGVGLDRAAVTVQGAVYRATTLAHFPRLAATLDAVAEAAGVEVELIYAINARSELLYGTVACGAPGDPPAGEGECTSLGVLGSHTVNGHTIIGQNWDWHPEQRPYTLLLITRDERGHEIAALTEAGMLAKAGLNSRGVGVCVNLLGSDRDGRPGGVPYHVLLRSVLEADSLSWSLRNAIRSPRSASINLMIGAAAQDGPGEVIDLELVPGDSAWLHPQDGLLVHANHFEAPLPIYDTIKDWGGSSLFRSARMRRLLADRIAEGKGRIDGPGIVEALCDHQSAPISICRHVDERDAVLDRSETIWTVVMDLEDRSIQLIAGPPCTGGEGQTFRPFS
ncbi:isopenicillin-N N-acyltransferase-like protein [Allocatelliglobosispora scoriae]|uniref:Isopenicillin-N N-acyltransferase-like protein n=2 Tax=Allocatelliglobosispora scoriae TaxID=643052 RepID=A0A841BUE0_9ACTN|nr:isopenicillin-N N-acyltransferase-like protein [Allocatelliglobosispora scoriae]